VNQRKISVKDKLKNGILEKLSKEGNLNGETIRNMPLEECVISL